MDGLKHIYLDMDGVLVDFVGGALKAHGVREYTHPPGEWWIHHALGMTDKQFWSLLSGEWFWRNLEPTVEWPEFVSLAESLVGQRNVFLLTSPSLDPYCLAGKQMWVNRHMPSYGRKMIPTAYKEQLARPGALLIDDSDANVEKFRKAGGLALLVPRIWNSRHELRDRAAEVVREEAIAMKS